MKNFLYSSESFIEALKVQKKKNKSTDPFEMFDKLFSLMDENLKVKGRPDSTMFNYLAIARNAYRFLSDDDPEKVEKYKKKREGFNSYRRYVFKCVDCMIKDGITTWEEVGKRLSVDDENMITPSEEPKIESSGKGLQVMLLMRR